MECFSLSPVVSFLLLRHLNGPISSISISSVSEVSGLGSRELFGVLVLNFLHVIMTISRIMLTIPTVVPMMV